METMVVGIAEAAVSNQPGCQLVTHALGSCVAVAIYDAQAKVAGLLHVMLPDSAIDREKAKIKPYMYADSGIRALLEAAMAKGAEKKRITVRLVGGAQVLRRPIETDPGGVFNIGKRNHLACRKVLWAAGLLVHGEEVGGTVSRTVSLDVASGRLVWHTGGGPAREMPVPMSKSSIKGGAACHTAY